jgi:hypothetical protein
MSNTNTGGPAFPTTLYEHGWQSDGMTLRDYFAAKAMQTFLSIEGGTLEKDAEMAYRAADAMLEARKV